MPANVRPERDYTADNCGGTESCGLYKKPDTYPDIELQSGGAWAAEFGDIDDSQESFFEIFANFDTSRTIYFWALGDAETCCDHLRVYFYDSQQLNTLPTTWTEFSISVPSGYQSVKWLYHKDGSVSTGADTIWIDDITIE